MNYEVIALIAFAVIGLAIIVFTLKSRKPKRIDTDQFAVRWQELQKNCADKKNWHIAVVEADRLLDEVLKKRHYKGKTTGERLVSAQHAFSNNESLWFGHKLYNRIQDDGFRKLSKRDTLEALGGFRQALKDLGALKDKIITAPPEAENVTVVLEPEQPRQSKPERKA